MNILFVTKDIQDADLIRHELARLVPDAHVEVSPDIDEAIGIATTPGRFDAVLVDSGLREGAPSALIRALRSQALPVAVVGLAGPSDLHSVAKIMGAGADDYVLKRAGYAATLPAVLRRAWAKYDGNEHPRSSVRLLYATESPEIPRRPARSTVVLRPVPNGRDATGATSFLLRDVPEDHEPAGKPDQEPVEPAVPPLPHSKEKREVFLQALKISNANRIKLKGELSAARLQWEQERAALEERSRTAADELHKALQERSTTQDAMQALEYRLAQDTEDLRAERQQREHWHTILKQRLAAVEESRAALEQSVLLESERYQQLEGECHAYGAELEDARRELEQQRRLAAEETHRLQALIQAAETRIGDLSSVHRTEGEQWEATRAELEARISELEKTRSVLECEYRDKLARELEQSAAAAAHDLRLAIEKHEAESAQWNSVRTALEHRVKQLQDELVTARDENARLLETGQEYRGKLEIAETELQQLRSGVSEVHALAREAADLYQLFLEKLRSFDSAAISGTGPAHRVD